MPTKSYPPLDEKGFVFLGRGDRPFYCCLHKGNPSLFRWHKSGHWIFSRKVSEKDIASYPRNVHPREQLVLHGSHVACLAYLKRTRKNFDSISGFPSMEGTGVGNDSS